MPHKFKSHWCWRMSTSYLILEKHSLLAVEPETQLPTHHKSCCWTKCRGQWDGLQTLQLREKSLDLLKSIGCSQSIAWELSCALSAITMACSAWGRPGLATVVGLVSENQAGRGIPLRICIPFLNNMVKQDLPWWIPQILFWEQNVHGTDWLYIQAMTVHHVSSSSCFSLQS